MMFSELYSAYYNTVAGVLKLAVQQPLSRDALRSTIALHAFGESVLNIEPALTEERWQLIRPDGTTPLQHSPTMPLTLLEKRWLKAISADPRIRLFCDETFDFPDVEPLFTKEDICIFDRYADGDPYEDESYRRNFRLILDAIEKHLPLSMDVVNRSGTASHKILMPEYLEYSEKDDKFRLIGSGGRSGYVINLARIVSCRLYTMPFRRKPSDTKRPRPRTLEFELIDERNALDRALLHFAHFEKQAERIDGDRYRVTLSYDRDDETELVIRILSFGPMIKVTAPQYFVEQIKERLLSQKSCEH